MRKRVDCNENCFECIYDDCIMDILPSEKEKQRERQKLYYQRHREEKKAYYRAYYQKQKGVTKNAE